MMVRCPWNTMVYHGSPWSYNHGQPWLNIVDHVLVKWPLMVDHGRIGVVPTKCFWSRCFVS